MLHAVVGLQFGDEGKGKFVDYLSSKLDGVARFSGGANAGHSVQYKNTRLAFSQLPATLYGKDLYVCQGALISPKIILKEIKQVESMNNGAKIHIDPRCHIVLPIHAELNKASEAYKTNNKIGSVGIGIGACFEDKANRHGVRLCDAVDINILKEKLLFLWEIRKNQINNVFNGSLSLNFEQTLSELHEQCMKLKPYFSFTNKDIRTKLNSGKKILLETSQATFLDNGFGSYPFTVAYPTLVQNCFPLIGIPAQEIHVVGVFKCYMIRVGNGPFPTEISSHLADYIRRKGNEYGTVSKRERRCGWLDLPLIKQAVELNGVTELAITNVDVLSELDEVYVCVDHQHKGEKICCDQSMLHFSEVEPMYRIFDGWTQLKNKYSNKNELPENLIEFLKFIESYIGVPIKYISHGPDREHTIIDEAI